MLSKLKPLFVCAVGVLLIFSLVFVRASYQGMPTEIFGFSKSGGVSCVDDQGSGRVLFSYGVKPVVLKRSVRVGFEKIKRVRVVSTDFSYVSLNDSSFSVEPYVSLVSVDGRVLSSGFGAVAGRVYVPGSVVSARVKWRVHGGGILPRFCDSSFVLR